LLDGNVIILTDGTPFALIAPTQFSSLMQSSEDYFSRWPIISFTRCLRYIALLIALALPSFYVSLISYNHGMIPTDLAIRIANSREGVPFPAFAEAFLMQAAFEVLREAGLRMPRVIGQAMSIVGVLVIGEAAVRAGFISSPMIIIVGLTALCSFAIPNYTLGNAIRIVQFFMLLLASVFGIFGLMAGLFLILIHLVSLHSFGVPYFTPIAPFHPKALIRDGILRSPWWAVTKRFSKISRDSVRNSTNLKREGEE
jgi:hypothetical protein